MANKQSQAGGDDSTNIQAETMVVNLGVDEKRAREICREMSLQLREEYSREALKVASGRVEQFENSLIPKMQKVDGALKAFADPSFQLLLVEAQKTAASTERPVDYDLLSELLIHRFEKGSDRIMRAGISRAVEIVDDISDGALLGLTVAHTVSSFLPASGDIIQGLSVLDDLYEKIIYGKLPEGQEWIDHLDILNAARIGSFGEMKKIHKYYPEILSGYVDVGIEKNSADHDKAINLLQKNNLPEDVLVDHALNGDFVRINIRVREEIGSFQIHQKRIQNGSVIVHSTPVSSSQIDLINSLYDLYNQDDDLKNKNIDTFIEEWDKRANLKKLREWWDSIPGIFLTLPASNVSLAV